MVQTTGDVAQVQLLEQNRAACVRIENADGSGGSETFLVNLLDDDPETLVRFKKSMIAMLYKAMIAGHPVEVEHGESDSTITEVSFVSYDISPVGRAIRDDFYSVTGSNIPTDGTVEFVFESATGVVVEMPADMVRPHWAFLSQLPPDVRLGRNWVSLQGDDYTSDQVPIDVTDEPPQRNRTLYSGAPKSSPYTVALIANPILQLANGAGFIADPISYDRPGFHDIVRFCLTNLLTLDEVLLTQDDMDASIRFVAIADPVFGSDVDNYCLVREGSGNLIVARQGVFNEYISRYFETADVAFAITGSTTHTRATARFAGDDESEAGTAFTFDGDDYEHGHFPRIPGACTISRYSNQGGLTALHEFGHMASDLDNGLVADLYVDGGPSSRLVVNKKWRDDASDPVPDNHSNYDGVTAPSDPDRDGLGYPSDWRSYHAELIDPDLPNLMDNYWRAPSGRTQECRLDEHTFSWFTDRLRAKINR